MKTFQLIAAIALAGFASAQSQCDSAAMAIPACGTTCLISAGSAHNCVSTDYHCQCSNSAAIMSACSDQVISQCGGYGSALAVQQSAQAVCSCAASYPAASGGGSSSSPATTTAPGGSASTPTGSTPTASVPTGGSSSHASTTAAPSSTSKNGTSPPIPTFSNGGITASSFMPVGGVFGLFIGLLAYL